ncbi:MAG: HlyC/CorC family transporter [Chloracidobacterium sp.]|nr:HlyC/CorC family transporter [Chloracidobacterium sp.]
MDDPASLLLLLLFAANTIPADAPSAPMSIFNIFLVLLLVLANGFFVASEFAFVAVRRSRIEALATAGSGSASRLVDVLNDLNAYISATQLGITLASLGLGWIGEPAVARLIDGPLFAIADSTGWAFLASPAVLHAISFAIAFSIITFLHIVFGELAPKTMALEISERMALLLALPMQVFYKVFYYPIRILDWTGTRTVRLFGLRASSDHGSIYTEDEIRQLINLSEASGHLNSEERQLIHSVFEFSETTVKEAMIPRTEIVAVPESVSLDELIKAFSESGFSRLPVTQGSLDEIAGYVHTRDLVKYIGRPEAFDLAEIIHKANYVVDNARLEDVLRQMQGEKFHFGFVVDEHGGIEGIITLEDLLEEIVGEISDEHDAEVNRQIARQPDGSCILDGGLAVRDLNRREKLNLPVSEAYTTLAGFMMSRAGQVLAVGDTVPFNGHVFEVEKMEKRRIRQIRMRKADESA